MVPHEHSNLGGQAFQQHPNGNGVAARQGNRAAKDTPEQLIVAALCDLSDVVQCCKHQAMCMGAFTLVQRDACMQLTIDHAWAMLQLGLRSKTCGCLRSPQQGVALLVGAFEWDINHLAAGIVYLVLAIVDIHAHNRCIHHGLHPHSNE